MKRLVPATLLVATVALALACGGGGGASGPAAPAAPAFGTVAYQTYNGGSTRIKFSNETKAKITWRNMSGPAVEATYTQDGDQVVIEWGTPDNTTSRTTKMKQLDECQLVQYYRLDKEGVAHEDDSKMFIKDDDRCRR